MITNLLLSGGPTHDFADTALALADLLRESPPAAAPIATTIVHDPDEFFERLHDGVDGVDGKSAPWDLVTVHALRWRMEAERYAAGRDEWSYSIDPNDTAALADYVRNGMGLLALHTAVICFDADPTWHALTGASWNWETSSHPLVDRVVVEPTIATEGHPITAGTESFELLDEVYGFLDEVDGIEPLLTGFHSGRAHPVLWARSVGAGRVVTDVLGHGVESLSHPTHRAILRRSAAWAAGGR